MTQRLAERIKLVCAPEEATDSLKVMDRQFELLADVVDILLDHASEHAKHLVDQLLTPPTK